MKKKISFDIKNIVLAVLLIAAVCQTGSLWLENYSGHNFFYYISSLRAGSAQENMSELLLDAEYITVGYGNKLYSVLYGKNSKEIKTKTDAVVAEISEKSTEAEVVDFYAETDLEQKNVIYTMPCESSVAEYVNVVTEYNNKTDFAGATFDIIIIMPGSTINDGSSVLFADIEKNTAVKINAVCSSAAELYQSIDTLSRGDTGSIQYISTAQNGFNIFSHNIFVPQWTQSSLEYTELKREQLFDFDNRGDVIAGLEIFFGSYFGQSEENTEDDIITISDSDTVVKYYKEGIIEYYSYKTDTDGDKQSLYSAYYVCSRFLESDTSMNTDYYLADVQLKNNSLVFCYDYCIDNMPIIVDGEMGMEHAIEVVVKNNTIKRYRRYAYDFKTDINAKFEADRDFLDAMNETVSLADDETNVTAVDNIVLGYSKADGDIYTLKWFTYIGDKVYKTEALGS